LAVALIVTTVPRGCGVLGSAPPETEPHALVTSWLMKIVPPAPPSHALLRSLQATASNVLAPGAESSDHDVPSRVRTAVLETPAARHTVVEAQRIANNRAVVPDVSAFHVAPPSPVLITVPASPAA